MDEFTAANESNIKKTGKYLPNTNKFMTSSQLSAAAFKLTTTIIFIGIETFVSKKERKMVGGNYFPKSESAVFGGTEIRPDTFETTNLSEATKDLIKAIQVFWFECWK